MKTPIAASSAVPAVLRNDDRTHNHNHPIAIATAAGTASGSPGGPPRKCRGPLLKAVIQHFSSTPLDPDPEIHVTAAGGHSSAVGTTAPFDAATPDAPPPLPHHSSPSKPHPHGGNRFSSTPLRPPPPSSAVSQPPALTVRTDPSPYAAFEGRLTEAERVYLEQLWHSGTLPDVEAALNALNDANLFFVDPLNAARTEQEEKKEDGSGVDDKTDVVVVIATTPPPSPHSPPPLDRRRRDPRLQQQLFRWHETQAVPPSQVLHRLTLVHRNSLLLDSSFSDGGDVLVVDDSSVLVDDDDTGVAVPNPRTQARHSNSILAASIDQDDNSRLEDDDVDADGGDPFDDVSSWLDGSLAATDDLASSLLFSKPPFKILGTSADDAACHPRVLSPPLMESLAAFVPELWTESHWWLRYSRSRDHGNLRNLLQVARSSVATMLAIETTDGHVLGCFTTSPWHFSDNWYGASTSGATSSASFVWKMRRNRCLDSATTANARSSASFLVRQVCQESEIQVYPYRSTTNASPITDDADPGADDSAAVQRCTEVDGLQLGRTELADPGPQELEGLHYGHALSISPDLKTGSTSTSETFGNPCLVKGEWRGAEFDVANLELWTLTLHATVGTAEQSALSSLFRGASRPNITSVNTGKSEQN